MHVVLVDARDSFAHNLAQALGRLGAEVSVVQCDAIDAPSLLARHPDLVVLGPGPGRPEDAGCYLDAVRLLVGRLPLLGVCLGHQALAQALGGELLQHAPVHGQAPPVHHDGTGLFEGLPPGVPMTRYNSLVVDPTRLPAALRITAWSDDGAVMALAHREHPAWGVQFHPESVLSGEHGLALLRNALAASAAWASRPRAAVQPPGAPGHL